MRGCPAPVMSLFSQITLNTLISYGGRVISSVFALISVGLMARALGAKGFGEYTIITAYLTMFVILADLGLHVLMTREISKRPEQSKGFHGAGSDGVREIASSFFTLRLFSSLVFLFTGFTASLLFPYSAAVKVGMGIGVIGFFFLSINQLLLGVFQRYLAMPLATFAEIIGRGAQLLFVYFIYKLSIVPSGNTPAPSGGGVFPTSSTGLLWWFVGAMSAASVIIFALQYIFARRYIAIGLNFNIAHWKEIIKITWPIALSIVLTLIYFKIDTIFLSFMKPQADVGIYGAAYRVLESLLFFPAMFAGIIMPVLSKEASLGDLSRFREVFGKAFRIITIFAFPIAVGGIIFSYSIASLIGGRDFVAAGAPLQALFVATGIIFWGNLLGRAVIALDLQKRAVLVYLFGVALNVVLNLIFIPKYTYNGAAWTTVATEAMITIFLFWLVWKKARVSFEFPTMIKSALAAGVMGGALIVFIPSTNTPISPYSLVLSTIFCGGFYFALLYLIEKTRAIIIRCSSQL